MEIVVPFVDWIDMHWNYYKFDKYVNVCLCFDER
jgi:hypothetical protein